MFESLAELRYEDCNGKYERVRATIEPLSQDLITQDRIYRVLWQHGGRCDCTVSRNVVALPEVKNSVDQEIQAILASA